MRVSSSDVFKNSPSQNSGLTSETKTKVSQNTDVKTLQNTQTKEFSVKTILESLLKELSSNQKSKETILKILQAKNIPQNIKDTTAQLNSIIKDLKSSKIPLETTSLLDKSLLDIEKIDAKSLQRQISNSGLFLESKLANLANKKLTLDQNPQKQLLDDVKANLLKVADELGKSGSLEAKEVARKIDRVLTNINYYQLISYSSNANILYLPLLWEGLEEGRVSLKKLKRKRFFCEINLKLKEFGEMDLLIMLFDDMDINLSIFTSSDDFLNRIRENLQTLKQSINSVGLRVSNINLYDYTRDERAKKELKRYAQSQQISQGMSLYV